MRKYIEIAKIAFKNEIIYKFDVLINVLLSVFKIILAYILWKAIFAENDSVVGYTFHQMILYYILIGFFSNIDKSNDIVGQLSAEIKGGKFTKYLITPVKPMLYFMFTSLAKTAFILIINICVTAIFIFTFNLSSCVNVSVEILALCCLITFLSLTFLISMNYFVGILSFKFKNVNGFNMIKSMLMQLVTGTLVPIVLFPELVQKFMKFLPFPYLYSASSTLLIYGNTSEALFAIIALVAWNVIMILISCSTYRHLRKEYEGVGV